MRERIVVEGVYFAQEFELDQDSFVMVDGAAREDGAAEGPLAVEEFDEGAEALAATAMFEIIAG